LGLYAIGFFTTRGPVVSSLRDATTGYRLATPSGFRYEKRFRQLAKTRFFGGIRRISQKVMNFLLSLFQGFNQNKIVV
jgi:hypothetical protein